MIKKLYLLLKKHYLLSIIIVVTSLSYSNILNAPFVFDSGLISYQKNINDFEFLQIAGRHITNITFILNESLNLGVQGYHLTNILFHIINIVLVYYFISLTVILNAENTTNVKPSWMAVLGAALFALHPIQTNAVTYTIQRAVLLATMFCLLSIILYIKGVLRTKEKKLSAIFFIGSIVTLFMALLSKENAIIFPLIVILYDYFFLSAFRIRVLFTRLFPLILLCFSMLFVISFKFSAISLGNNLFKIISNINTPIPYDYPWMGIDVYWTPLQHFLTGFRIAVRYISILIYPIPSMLCFDYGPNYLISQDFFNPLTTPLSVIFVLALILGSIYYAKKFPLPSFGILFYFITISLESFLLVGLDLYFEHRNYLPSVGFFLFISSIISYNLNDFSKKYSKIFLFVFFLIIFFLSYATYSRNKIFNSKITLWESTLTNAPNNKRALDILALEYMEVNNYNKAVELLYKGLSISIPTRSTDYIIYSHLIKIYVSEGKYDKAIYYLQAMEKLLGAEYHKITLRKAEIYCLLGEAYYLTGDIQNAHKYLLLSLTYPPSNWSGFTANLILGQIEFKNNNIVKSQSYYEGAISYFPANPLPYLYLGDVLYLQNKTTTAEETYKKGISIAPYFADLYIQLCQLYLAEANYQSASETVKKAVEIMPDNLYLLIKTAELFFSNNRWDEAIIYLRKAADLSPDNPSVYYFMGLSFFNKGDIIEAKKYFLKFIDITDSKKDYQKEITEIRDKLSNLQ